jgi:hypothetical protein
MIETYKIRDLKRIFSIVENSCTNKQIHTNASKEQTVPYMSWRNDTCDKEYTQEVVSTDKHFFELKH